MSNSIQPGRTIWPFHNPVDPAQNTYIMGNVPNAKIKADFGILNRELGRYSENCLDLSLGFGVIGDYIRAFFDPKENLALNIINKTIFAGSDFFAGQRDRLMYKIFGHSIDAEIYNEVTHDPNALGRTNKVPEIQERFKNKGLFVDDLGENIGQKQAYGEEIVPFWGWVAALSASIKPIVSPIAAFLPQNFKSAADSIIDTGARAWWRMRMFGHSLHANFLTSTWNLAKDGALSFVSTDANSRLQAQKQKLGSFAKQYFEETGKTDIANQGRSHLGLYTSMLADRVKTHWNNVWTKNDDLHKNLLDNGSITAKDGYTGRDLKLAAISELSAPFCSAIGLAGTFVFEPLRLVWNFAGFEAGKNIISAMSSLRKATHLGNYLTRFVAHEVFSCDNETYREIERAMKDGTATELQKQLHSTLNTRRRNGYLGLLMSAGNIVEPLAHLSGFGNSESKISNFAFSLFTRLNDTGLLRFFSTRRETIGRGSMIQAIAAKQNKTIDQVHLTSEQIQNEIQKLYEENKIDEHFDGITKNIITTVERAKESANSEDTITAAYTSKALVA